MHGTHAGLAGGERSASGLATRPSALGENERVRVRALTSSRAHACAHTRAHTHDHSASDQGLVPWKDQSMGEKWRRAPLRRAAPGPGRGSFPRVGREGGRWPPGAAGCRAGGSRPGGHQARPRDPSPRAGARDPHLLSWNASAAPAREPGDGAVRDRPLIVTPPGGRARGSSLRISRHTEHPRHLRSIPCRRRAWLTPGGRRGGGGGHATCHQPPPSHAFATRLLTARKDTGGQLVSYRNRRAGAQGHETSALCVTFFVCILFPVPGTTSRRP